MAGPAKKAGESQTICRIPEHKKRDRTMTCRGIGAGSQSTDWGVKHHIGLGNGRIDIYTAPELPNSQTAGPLGQNKMKSLRFLKDTFTGALYLVGAGNYELRLSPASEKHVLE